MAIKHQNTNSFLYLSAFTREFAGATSSVDGYKGLVENNIQMIDRSFVSGIVQKGGTILRTARLREFKEEFESFINLI